MKVVNKEKDKLKKKKIADNVWDRNESMILGSRTNKTKLEELEVASRILNNLQEARKNGIFGLKDNREANMDMIDERIDKLIEFIADENNDIE